MVPSGSTDLTDAEVVNEKGSSVCPYAAPFEDIDLDGILSDVRNQSERQYRAFLAYLDANMDFVASAIDGTTAGALSNRIAALEGSMTDAEFIDYMGGD